MRVRTTTSTRAVEPRWNFAPAWSIGAASRLISRRKNWPVVSASSPTANEVIACCVFSAAARRCIGNPGAVSAGDAAKISTVMKPDLQKLLDGLQLRLILIDVGHGRIGGGKAVRVNHAVAVARIVEGTSGMWQSAQPSDLSRVVERARALAGNAAGLPVVVIVEAAHPAVVVHRHIQVHLVARRAELRRLAA